MQQNERLNGLGGKSAIVRFGAIVGSLVFAASVSAQIHPMNEQAGSYPASKLEAAGASKSKIENGFVPTVVTNGVVSLGVNPEGNLIDDAAAIGLTYVPTAGEALWPGCNCEAWGVGDDISKRYGQAGEVSGDTNIVVESFVTTATTATSVVVINDGEDLFRVTHDYAPSSSPNLYQGDVTIENISAEATELLYRRAMDWDVPPTEFDELVTLYTGGAANVIFSSDDGFADGNPFAGQTFLLFTGEAEDSGPADHGALFDFDFGTLAPGASFSFKIFYGAAGNQDEALAALAAVGAEVYSLGKPNPAVEGVGEDGSPNTFIFGFAGVGGAPIGETVAVPFFTPVGLALVIALLGLYGVRRIRRA